MMNDRWTRASSPSVRSCGSRAVRTTGLALSLLICGCSSAHLQPDVSLGPDTVIRTRVRPVSGYIYAATFIPVGERCTAVAWGTASAPAPDLLLTTSDVYAGVWALGALAYGTSCEDAIEHWEARGDITDLRVEPTGHLDLLRVGSLSGPIDDVWNGEIRYVEPWEGGEPRWIVLTDVPSHDRVEP
jgi:hypothetical protein